MQGDLNPQIPTEMEINSPIMASTAVFPNGNYVIGGVLKSGNADLNTIFMWVFNKNGTQYPGWVIDVSDYEDFDLNGMDFEVEGCQHTMKVEEKKSEV